MPNHYSVHLLIQKHVAVRLCIWAIPGTQMKDTTYMPLKSNANARKRQNLGKHIEALWSTLTLGQEGGKYVCSVSKLIINGWRVVQRGVWMAWSQREEVAISKPRFRDSLKRNNARLGDRAVELTFNMRNTWIGIEAFFHLARNSP